MAAEHILHMQKALSQMNLQLHHVLSDITGTSGQAILDAILSGQRDPVELAQLCHSRVKSPRDKVAQALVGANSLCRAKGYFGEFFRRMRAKLGTAQAITATAHKIARILYHVLSTKEPYAETVFHRCDEQAQRRAEMRLRKQAAFLGFQLLPITTTGE